MAVKSSKKNLKKLLDIAQDRKIQKLNPEQKLSLCMIVKNEEENLERCLKSVEGIVDEIVIVDTGSTDKTVDIAKKNGAKVFYYEWENDFGKARNEAIRNATGDWILVLDADEELDKNTKDNIRAFLVDIGKDFAYQLKIKSFDYKNNLTIENYMVRLFKKSPNIRFFGRIHEYLVGTSSIINISHESLSIIHHGYKDKEKVNKKNLERNLPILKMSLEDKNISDLHKSFMYFYLGTSYTNNNELDIAIDYLEKSVKYLKDKENQPTVAIYPYIKLLNLYTFQRKFDKLEEVLKKSQDDFKEVLNTGDYWYFYGILQKEKNNNNEAINYFNKAIANFEDESKSLFLLALDKTPYYYAIYQIAELYFNSGNNEEARVYLDKAMKFLKEFTYPAYFVIVAKLYEKLNDFNKALEIYNYLLENSLDIYKNELKNYISNIYLKQNKFADAIKLQAEIHNPNLVKENWYYLAQSLEDEKIFPSAEEIYSVIIDIIPEEVRAYLGRAVSRLIQNKVVDALSDLALAKKFANNKDDLLKIAIIYLQIGQLNQSKNILNSILEAEPTDLESNLYLASIEQSEGKFVESANRLERMISIYDNNTKPYIQLGNLFITIGKIEEAENIFSKVLELDKLNPYAYYALSLCNIQKGEKDKALYNLEKSLELEPTNQGLIELYSNIQ
ncbi:MAG: glycosyl transferase [Candidatus Sericytochromatia bacterium]|nr:MAG: glycosyl transferase [Candidatus Sericytochromatia bacterium]